MGAQSVTGVSGWGSAEATSKGPKERNFVGVEKLIGPRVILAAQATLVGGAATYLCPETLSLGITEVNILASAVHAVTVTKTVDASGHVTGCTLAGTGTDVVDLAFVLIGNSL